MKVPFRLVVAGLVVSVSAFAQPPAGPQVRLRGTVQEFTGQTLSMRTGEGAVVRFDMAPPVGINGVARRSLGDIVDNAFVGVTAAPGGDGRLHASEVHIFPEEMRGAGEGHYPWDFPESTMTNAAVTGIASAGSGRALTLTHAGGEVEVVVDPDTAIVALVAGDASLFVQGATVFVLGLQGEGGAVTPIAIVAEKDGVKPPM